LSPAWGKIENGEFNAVPESRDLVDCRY